MVACPYNIGTNDTAFPRFFEEGGDRGLQMLPFDLVANILNTVEYHRPMPVSARGVGGDMGLAG